MSVRRFVLLLCTLSLAAFLPHRGTAPERWALIIGISDYTNFGSEIGGDLPGAAWDARRMRDVLVARWGYPAEHVRLLLDGEATRSRIQSELTQWLPSVVRDGDVVTVFFAGHGSQAWDTNGDEPDGLDETICPADVTKGDASADITDDELETWLQRVPTTRLSVVLDNCHSGTGTRAVTPFARPRALGRSAATDLPRPSAQPGGIASPATQVRGAWLEMAAAQADEVAVDAEWPGENGAPSTYGGAFTTHLVRNLWRVSPRTTYEELFRLTVEDMKRERFAQQPLLTVGGLARAPFAFADAGTAAVATLPVLRRGDAVELGGGAGAGMTVGSLYRAGGSLLRVTAVHADRALVTPVRGPAPAAGAAAQLIAWAPPAAELRVSVADLDATTQRSLRAAVQGIAGVVVTQRAQEFAHVLLRPAERGYVLLGMDGSIRHNIAGSGTAAMTRTAGLLGQELAAQALALLDNPGQPESLPFAFSGGATVFEFGDSIAFTVRIPRDGYLTVVDLGTDGTVSVIYPTGAEENRKLRAETELRLPGGDLAFEAEAPAGRGMVRAFVTDQPLGLMWQQGDGSRAAEVGAALRRAAGAPPVEGSNAIPTGSWLSASIVYTIQAK